MVPGFGNIFISNDSPAAKEEGRHFNNIAPIEREVIRREVEARGFSVERMQQTYLARWTFNMLTYSELTDPNAIPKPFKIKQKTFF